MPPRPGPRSPAASHARRGRATRGTSARPRRSPAGGRALPASVTSFWPCVNPGSATARASSAALRAAVRLPAAVLRLWPEVLLERGRELADHRVPGVQGHHPGEGHGRCARVPAAERASRLVDGLLDLALRLSSLVEHPPRLGAGRGQLEDVFRAPGRRLVVLVGEIGPGQLHPVRDDDFRQAARLLGGRGLRRRQGSPANPQDPAHRAGEQEGRGAAEDERALSGPRRRGPASPGHRRRWDRAGPSGARGSVAARAGVRASVRAVAPRTEAAGEGSITVASPAWNIVAVPRPASSTTVSPAIASRASASPRAISPASA